MKVSIKKEFLIYIAILLVFAVSMHSITLIDRFFIAIKEPSIFIHPFIYSGIIYLIIFVIRAIFNGVLKFFFGK